MSGMLHSRLYQPPCFTGRKSTSVIVVEEQFLLIYFFLTAAPQFFDFLILGGNWAAEKVGKAYCSASCFLDSAHCS